jgi:GT2 family glycosyltransferase
LDNVFFIQNNENKGYAAGNNVGIRHAQSKYNYEYFWILNNDTIIPEKSIQSLIAYIQEHPAKQIIGSILVYFDNPETIQATSGKFYFKKAMSSHLHSFSPLNTLSNDFEKGDYPVGASLVVKNSYFEKVGMMHDDYFLYFEEIEWITRGVKYFGNNSFWDICKDFIVIHKEGASTGSSKTKSQLSDFYYFRNRILFTKKYFPQYISTLYFSIFLGLSKRIVKFQWKRVWMVIKIIANPKMHYSI